MRIFHSLRYDGRVCSLKKEHREFTGFSTSKGHYQYCVCPQGIKKGPSWFNLCVTTALKDCREYAASYFDDIVIFSKTIEDHLDHIKLVMEALKKANFKISAKKSVWIAKEIVLLDFVINAKEVKIKPG